MKASNVFPQVAIIFICILFHSNLKAEEELTKEEQHRVREILKDYHPFKQQENIERLVAFGPRIKRFLLQQKKFYRDPVRLNAIDTTVFLLEYNLPPQMTRVYMENIVLLLLSQSDKELTKEMKKKIDRASSEEDIDTLIGLLKEQNTAIVLKALKQIIELGDHFIPKLIEKLRLCKYERFNNTTAFCLSLALLSLGAEAEDALEDQVLSKNIARALGMFASRKRTDKWISLLNHPDLAGIGADALAISGDIRAFKALKGIKPSWNFQYNFIRAISYCKPEDEDFSFAIFINTNGEQYSETREAIRAAARTRDKSSLKKIIKLAHNADRNLWPLSYEALSAIAIFDKHEAGSLALKKLRNWQRLSALYARYYYDVAIIFSWCLNENVISKSIQNIPKNRLLTIEEAYSYAIAVNERRESATALLLRAILKNYDNNIYRQNILQILSYLDTRDSIQACLQFLLDPEAEVRAMLFLNLYLRHHNSNEVWFDYICSYWPFFPDSDFKHAKEQVDSIINEFEKRKPFFYYFYYDRPYTNTLKCDWSALKAKKPLNPYTKEACAKEEIENFDGNEKKLKKLLSQIQQKQNKAWSKKQGHEKGKDRNAEGDR